MFRSMGMVIMVLLDDLDLAQGVYRLDVHADRDHSGR